jgi:hypothetical protein
MSQGDQTRSDGEFAVCHVCGQEFDTQLELSDHLMKEHPDDLLPDQPTDDGQ